MSDLVDDLLLFEGSDALGDGDFSVCIRAADEIERLRKIEVAARDMAATLIGGFIACQNCGEQEDTTDIDYARELYAALGMKSR